MITKIVGGGKFCELWREVFKRYDGMREREWPRR